MPGSGCAVAKLPPAISALLGPLPLTWPSTGQEATQIQGDLQAGSNGSQCCSPPPPRLGKPATSPHPGPLASLFLWKLSKVRVLLRQRSPVQPELRQKAASTCCRAGEPMWRGPHTPHSRCQDPPQAPGASESGPTATSTLLKRSEPF